MIDINAFKGATAKTIKFPYTISTLENGLLKGLTNLTSIELLLTNDIGGKIPTVSNNLFGLKQDNEGNLIEKSNVVIYVPSNRYSEVTTDYFWAGYSSQVKSR